MPRLGTLRARENSREQQAECETPAPARKAPSRRKSSSKKAGKRR